MIIRFENIICVNHSHHHNFITINASINAGTCLILVSDNSNLKKNLMMRMTLMDRSQKNIGGKIFFNDYDIDIIEHHYKRHIGYLPYSSNGLYHRKLTVKQNLTIWAKLYDSMEAIEIVAKICDLEKIIEMKCINLNKSQLKMLCISQFLMLNRSRIWFMEDPYSDFLRRKAFFSISEVISYRCIQGIVIITCESDHLQQIKHYLESLNINCIVHKLEKFI